MKILTYDVETAPKLAHVWGVWRQNIPPKMLSQDGYILSWSAKWLDEPDTIYSDTLLAYGNKVKNEGKLVKGLHKLMEEADIIITYNGNKFDTPTVNTAFLRAGLAPPAPSKSIDLYRVVRGKFKFTSNKLDYVCKQLGLGGKLDHEGFELWLLCMKGDKDAWERMRRYNEQDVLLTEALYMKLRPWIKGHPNVNMAEIDGKIRCAACGSDKLKKNGYEYLTAGKYQRYRCRTCGANNRGTTTMLSTEDRRTLNRVL